MSPQDISVVCFDCGTTFVFSLAEQQEFEVKGHLHAPKRCPACRQTRKTRQLRNNTFKSPPPGSQLFAATCVQCGKSTQVPFEPKAGRPVYCRDCYQHIKNAR
jgi:CxxC-x17-CxxC domain-containing protein